MTLECDIMPAFPTDLIDPLREIVAAFSDEKYAYRRAFPLPDDNDLATLLCEAYFASFQTEEGRHPGFRVLFASEETLTKTEKHPHASRDRIIKFDAPRRYVAQEIIRLAPAAELRRFLVCVHKSPDHPMELEIWGLLDVGDNWWRFIRHESNHGISPPNHLTLTSLSPGEISVSAGGWIILSLKNGSIARPAEYALSSGPIADYLSTSKAALYQDVIKELRTKNWDDDGHDDDFPKSFYTMFLERVLFNVRARGHGGSIILVPDHIEPYDTRITDRVTVKYACLYDHAWGQLTASLVNHRRYFDLHFPLLDGRAELSIDNFNKHRHLSNEKDEIDQSLTDIAESIASLTAVDGAVLMTTRFRVYGFGAEVICPSPSLQDVRVAWSNNRLPISSYGTRHRSAFRLCSNWEDSIAFVVSHDGGVKAVKRVGPDVMLWPDINQGALGL
jgi:hypothetical protein